MRIRSLLLIVCGVLILNELTELTREIDLRKYTSFGMNAGANAASIRAVFRFLTASRK